MDDPGFAIRFKFLTLLALALKSVDPFLAILCIFLLELDFKNENFIQSHKYVFIYSHVVVATIVCILDKFWIPLNIQTVIEYISPHHFLLFDLLHNCLVYIPIISLWMTWILHYCTWNDNTLFDISFFANSTC